MPRLTVQGYLVDGSETELREITPHELVATFLGFDWGPPLDSAVFRLETDDGYRVFVGIDVPKQRSGDVPVTTWRASVKPPGAEAKAAENL
jgi:hypothetical protein